MVQGMQSELASAKEALQAAELQGMVEELQAGKAGLQQQVQSLQVMLFEFA